MSDGNMNGKCVASVSVLSWAVIIVGILWAKGAI